MSEDLERVIGKAVMDPAFREQLLKNTNKALQDAGFELSNEDSKALRDGIKDLKDNKNVKDDDGADAVFKAAAGGWWS